MMQRDSIKRRLAALEDVFEDAPQPVPVFVKEMSGTIINMKTNERFATEEEARKSAGNPEFCVIATVVDGRRKPKEIEHVTD